MSERNPNHLYIGGSSTYMAIYYGLRCHSCSSIFNLEFLLEDRGTNCGLLCIFLFFIDCRIA
jgi:hypothetical protein